MEPEDRRWWEKRRDYLVTPKPTVAEIEEALRENWARRRVAEAGGAWETHMAKFDGTVLRRDPGPIVARPTSPRALYAQMVGRAVRRPPVVLDIEERIALVTLAELDEEVTE